MCYYYNYFEKKNDEMDYLFFIMIYINLMLKFLIFVKNFKIRYYRIWLYFVNYIYNYINILKI